MQSFLRVVMMNKKRPKHLALHKIKLPLPGFVSILHRASGILLFLALPVLLWMLHASLRSIETHTQLLGLLQHPLSKLVVLGLIWSFFHHFCAGIRFLALDLHIGSSLARARASSWWVMGVSLTLTLLAGGWLC
jgi:succinate dehydrogenase / fumarate reductase cytochrome b subunit